MGLGRGAAYEIQAESPDASGSRARGEARGHGGTGVRGIEEHKLS